MSETLQILEKVNAFYTASFVQLITYTGALLATVGVLLPLFIAFQQARQTKRDQESLTKALNVEVKDAEERLRAIVQGQIHEMKAEIDKALAAVKDDVAAQVTKLQSLSTAQAFHLQARVSMDKGQHESSLDSALVAIRHYAVALDEENLGSAIRITQEELKYVDASAFEDGTLETRVTRSLKALEPLDENGRYIRDINAIKKEMARAKTRKPTVQADDA